MLLIYLIVFVSEHLAESSFYYARTLFLFFFELFLLIIEFVEILVVYLDFVLFYVNTVTKLLVNSFLDFLLFILVIVKSFGFGLSEILE